MIRLRKVVNSFDRIHVYLSCVPQSCLRQCENAYMSTIFDQFQLYKVCVDIVLTGLCCTFLSVLFIIFTLKQVNNHFPIPMDLLCKKEEQFSRITTIQPDSLFNVPLILAHKAGLYLRPAGFGFVQKIPIRKEL